MQTDNAALIGVLKMKNDAITLIDWFDKMLSNLWYNNDVIMCQLIIKRFWVNYSIKKIIML